RFHLQKDNPFTDRFWGRIDLKAGAALYYFSKGGRTQQLIHHLKYSGKKEIGLKLGQLYGKMLLESPYFKGIDVIIPVPLHPRKQKKRGYNQSDWFAKGLSESMNCPWYAHGLQRIHMANSQTQKSRLERLVNVSQAFEVKNRALLEGKHILLVDDVLTTGATLEACSEKILQIPQTQLSLATIAITIT
ncbi:MAG: phosphoribosyltransferase family protein, partial [Bacteroidota bacterium]